MKKAIIQVKKFSMKARLRVLYLPFPLLLLNDNFFSLQESPTNITPLQIELLEKDLQDLKISLDEEKKLNATLSATVDKQKQ